MLCVVVWLWLWWHTITHARFHMCVGCVGCVRGVFGFECVRFVTPSEAAVAQLVERQAFNLVVAGSSPAGGAPSPFFPFFPGLSCSALLCFLLSSLGCGVRWSRAIVWRFVLAVCCFGLFLSRFLCWSGCISFPPSLFSLSVCVCVLCVCVCLFCVCFVTGRRSNAGQNKGTNPGPQTKHNTHTNNTKKRVDNWSQQGSNLRPRSY